MRFTRDCSAEPDRLKYEIETADAIIVGAGAGLSTAAGFTYSGARMQQYFADFRKRREIILHVWMRIFSIRQKFCCLCM